MNIIGGVKQPEVVTPKNALDYFPLESPRSTQVKVINEIQQAFSKGYRVVILEAPVGSGKSAIAISLARYFSQSHIITPRKSLQNQYYQDFSNFLVLMKGRSSYPCTYDISDGVGNPSVYRKYIKIIEQGQSPIPMHAPAEPHCGDAPCLDDKEVFKYCTELYDCPYHVAMDVASNSHHIVHNLHSFVFQSRFGKRFGLRRIMIIDEVHEVESMIRDFIAKKITLPTLLRPADEPGAFTNIREWGEWFLRESFVNLFSDKIFGHHKESDREKYIDRVQTLVSFADDYKENFVVKREVDLITRKTRFEFIPEYVGSAINQLIFSFGEKLLLMSGTIYSKDIFCRNNGLDPDKTYFLRIGSTFPVASRPIYMKREFMVDTSHAEWTNNLPKLVEIIRQVFEKFPDVKGLIHTPSYIASEQLYKALKDKRIITHDKHNFFKRLDEFFNVTGNQVFMSPICQQGMDFKDDRARFQIITRIPYPNTNDPFIQHKVENDFPWFNYQALIIFGQQIGRINRSEQDFGVTILADTRFEKFIAKNKKLLPGWVKEAIVK